MDIRTPSLPPGIVLAYAANNAPNGFLLCDGSQVSRTTYAALFAAIGTAHGVGDGATTFHLPDYRGMFLRGVDGGTNRDPDAAARTVMNPGGNTGSAVGSTQDSLIGSHTHTTWAKSIVIGGSGIHSFRKVDNSTDAGTNFLADVGYTGGNETRPKNAYVNYIIKV